MFNAMYAVSKYFVYVCNVYNCNVYMQFLNTLFTALSFMFVMLTLVCFKFTDGCANSWDLQQARLHLSLGRHVHNKGEVDKADRTENGHCQAEAERATNHPLRSLHDDPDLSISLWMVLFDWYLVLQPLPMRMRFSVPQAVW